MKQKDKHTLIGHFWVGTIKVFSLKIQTHTLSLVQGFDTLCKRDESGEPLARLLGSQMWRALKLK